MYIIVTFEEKTLTIKLNILTTKLLPKFIIFDKCQNNLQTLIKRNRAYVVGILNIFKFLKEKLMWNLVLNCQTILLSLDFKGWQVGKWVQLCC